jgi:hypothetical protein
MPLEQQYTRDQLLTNLSIAQKNAPSKFIADQAFPVAPVESDQGTYYEWGTENLSPEFDLRAPGTPANEIDYSMTEKPFGPLADHSLKVKVTDHNVKHAPNPLNPFKAATRILTEKNMLSKEVDAAAKYAAAANGATVSDSADRWDSTDTSDPIGMLKDAVDAFSLNAMQEPNTLILGAQVVRPLLDHPDVLSRLPDNSLRSAALQHISELIGVERILVGAAIRNTAVEGAALSKSYIWGKNVFFAYLTASPELESVSAAFTLEQVDGDTIERYRDEDISSTWVRKSRYYEHKITFENGIYKLLNVVN